MDELNPASCNGKGGVMGGSNGFQGMGASIVDAMSTLALMGMEEEFDRAKSWVVEHLDFSAKGHQRYRRRTRRLDGSTARYAPDSLTPTPIPRATHAPGSVFSRQQYGCSGVCSLRTI
jgi:hypothetical protein